MDILSSENICDALNECLKSKIQIEVLGKTASTNTLLKDYASNGAEEGFVLIAEEQTSGKGRLGRSFFSPENTGLYLSILLRPSFKAEKALNITTAAAVAVCRALEKAGADSPKIKWVNDIFVNGKKACGILTEASINGAKGNLDFAVLGIGINVYSPKNDFPDELKEIAGGVFADSRENLRNELCADIINEFFSMYYCGLEKGVHTKEYIERNLVIGKKVTVCRGEERRSAVVDGITEECHLSVTYENGEKDYLSSGEISLRL